MLIESGTTLVPMRAIFEAMGATVDWNNETKIVTSVKEYTTISLTLNNSTALVNNCRSRKACKRQYYGSFEIYKRELWGRGELGRRKQNRNYYK